MKLPTVLRGLALALVASGCQSIVGLSDYTEGDDGGGPSSSSGGSSSSSSGGGSGPCMGLGQQTLVGSCVITGAGGFHSCDEYTGNWTVSQAQKDCVGFGGGLTGQWTTNGICTSGALSGYCIVGCGSSSMIVEYEYSDFGLSASTERTDCLNANSTWIGASGGSSGSSSGGGSSSGSGSGSSSGGPVAASAGTIEVTNSYTGSCQVAVQVDSQSPAFIANGSSHNFAVATGTHSILFGVGGTAQPPRCGVSTCYVETLNGAQSHQSTVQCSISVSSGQVQIARITDNPSFCGPVLSCP